MKVIYTYTDEAPALATHSFLPVIEAFAGARPGSSVETRDISLAARILRRVRPGARRAGRARRAGHHPRGQHHQAAEHQRVDPAAQGGDQGAAGRGLRDARTTRRTRRPTRRRPRGRRTTRSRAARSTRCCARATPTAAPPPAVKHFARNHPHSMGAWSPESASHVVDDGPTATSATPRPRSPPPRPPRCASSTWPRTARSPCSRSRCPVLAGEIVDAAVMRRAALDAFLAEQVADAKERGVLFSVHLKATMMKVSRPDPVRTRRGRLLRRRVRPVRRGPRRASAPTRTTGWPACSPRSASCPPTSARRSRRPSPPPTRPGPRWPWSTPTGASPTCTCPVRRDHRRVDAGRDPLVRARCGTPRASSRTPSSSSRTRPTPRSTPRPSTSAASTARSTPPPWAPPPTSG